MPEKLEDFQIPDGFIQIILEEGRKYSFCTCGFSKNLPFCDDSHRILNQESGTSYKSLKIYKKDGKIYVFSSNWGKKQNN